MTTEIPLNFLCSACGQGVGDEGSLWMADSQPAPSDTPAGSSGPTLTNQLQNERCPRTRRGQQLSSFGREG